MTTVTQPAAIDFLGATARVLATGGALGLVHMDKPAGDMPPLHVHHNEDEGFYVLEGRVTLYRPGVTISPEKDSIRVSVRRLIAVIVPGTKH